MGHDLPPDRIANIIPMPTGRKNDYPSLSMPELPEVETTRNGIAPHILGQTIRTVIVRERRLRWPIPNTLEAELEQRRFTRLDRRGKYLLFYTGHGCLLLHLGMSGSLRIHRQAPPAEKHDHVDILFGASHTLRFRDPRRFGSLLWTHDDPYQHRLLKTLGPEPLDQACDPDYLYRRSRKSQQVIKVFIMNAKIVVGIGNIYANEILFQAGILPGRIAGSLSKARYRKLHTAIQLVLSAAIKKGGSTLKDFTKGDGMPGYFQHHFMLYNRAGQGCKKCGNIIQCVRIAQRTSYYCSHCQT